MLRIDSHQHFWKYDPIKAPWITDDMAILKRDYLPPELDVVLKANGFDGCVVVQSDQSEEENDFQRLNAEKYNFVKGIVGWVNLLSNDVEKRLDYYSQFKKLKGFRHVLQDEQQRDFMLRPDFLNGISLLNKYDYTYDILINSDQLQLAKELVAKFPEQRFVIDHIAKPFIKDKILAKWRTDMIEISKYRNVFCKISGMVTETRWNQWSADEFDPYIDVVVETFGIDRVMFGSDWPVCTLSGSFSEVYEIVKDYFSGFSDEEQQKVFGKNAIEFYRL